jgi:hypothetical protein
VKRETENNGREKKKKKGTRTLSRSSWKTKGKRVRGMTG